MLQLGREKNPGKKLGIMLTDILGGGRWRYNPRRAENTTFLSHNKDKFLSYKKPPFYLTKSPLFIFQNKHFFYRETTKFVLRAQPCIFVYDIQIFCYFVRDFQNYFWFARKFRLGQKLIRKYICKIRVSA